MNVQHLKAKTYATTKRQRTEPGWEKLLPPTPGKRRRECPLKIFHATNKENVEE